MKIINIDQFQKGALFMTFEKIIKMFSHLLAAIVLARYLGPDQYGTLNFSYAFVSIFICLNSLGLEAIVVNKFVKYQDKRKNIFNVSFVMRILAGGACMTLILIINHFFMDNYQWKLILVLSVMHLFIPFSIYENYMMAVGRAHVIALLLIFNHVVTLLFRVFLVIYEADIVWVAVTYVFDFALVAAFYVVFVRDVRLSFSIDHFQENAKLLLKEAAPLMLSGLVIILYMKMDQIMLGIMLSEYEVGIYTAATKLSESWYFLGLTIVGVLFPKYISNMKSDNCEIFYGGLVNLTRMLFFGSLIICFIVWVLADFIVDFFYGSTFRGSAAVLSISMFAVPFVYLGGIASRVMTYFGRSKAVLLRSILGLIINLLLNYLLIPKYGAIGAAYATLTSQFFVGFVFSFVSSSTQLQKIFIRAMTYSTK